MTGSTGLIPVRDSIGRTTLRKGPEEGQSEAQIYTLKLLSRQDWKPNQDGGDEHKDKEEKELTGSSLVSTDNSPA